jgi:thiol:disulfide interchange protein DsbA
MMRFIRQILAVLSIGVVSLAAHATPANPQNGIDYKTLPKAVATSNTGKVEVIEFMWYDCPHCAAFDPIISAWAKKNADKIDFKQVPITFRDTFFPQQKLFYTLEAMGKTAELNPKVFKAIHADRQRVNTDKTILDFAQKQGLDKQAFLDTYNSFGVQTKARRAKQIQDMYDVDSVPMLAVGGQYITSPAMVAASLVNQPESMQQAATLQVLDYLVAKVAANEAEPAAKGAAAKKK